MLITTVGDSSQETLCPSPPATRLSHAPTANVPRAGSGRSPDEVFYLLLNCFGLIGKVTDEALMSSDANVAFLSLP